MNTYIVGAGSAGLLIATQLADAGQPVTLIKRNKPETGTIQVVKQKLSGEKTPYILPATGIADIKNLQLTSVIICTKAGDAFSVFQQLAPRLSHKSAVLFMNNGMGPQQQATTMMPDNVYWGTNTQGSYISKNGDLIHAGKGQLLAGHPESQPLPGWFPDIIQPEADIELALWRKLAVNALINPLTVKYQCRNGDLLANDAALHDMQQLSNEIEQLAQVLNIPLSSPFDLAVHVAGLTAGNWSSSMQDYAAGRKNELAFINGYIIQKSLNSGLKAGHHQRILNQIN